jgi:MFS family permease
MTGIVISGLTIGQMIAPPIISRLIAVYDWRMSYTMLGSFVLLAVIIAAQFLRRDPAKVGQSPYGANEIQQPGLPAGTGAYSLQEAVHTTQFWLVIITFFSFGFGAFAITVHIVPHAHELGISAITAANILAISGGIGIVGNFVLGGIVGDRIGNRKAFLIGFILMITALLWLAPAREVWMLYLIAILLGLAFGSMGTSESPLVARLFGLSSHGLIYGVIGLGFTAGGAVGPFVMGYMFDITSSYQTSFIVCAAFGVLGLILVTILRPTKKLGTKL